jgi:hypothetical protein
MASSKIERFLNENPSYREHVAFKPMTSEELAAFKALGG